MDIRRSLINYERYKKKAAIRRGDKIVTSGGLTGTVVKVIDDSDTIEVEIAKDVKVHVVRAMIADIRGKTEPVKK